MAAFLRQSLSGKILAQFSAFLRVNQSLGAVNTSSCLAFNAKRTLLSDAYHAEDTWINRERIVVDMDEMKINLDRVFYDLKEPVMSVELHKYIDNVYDKTELDVAEGYLYSYRHSAMASHLRQSTVHSWLRLCLELGFPDQALRVLQNKRDYGLFPEGFTYNLLLDSFLRADDFKGACDVAMVMMQEETLEDYPLSQLLALYACHHYLKTGDIPQEELWDVGMTLADATRGVEGSLSQSYHAIGYAMSGKLDLAIRVLESTLATDGASIAQEAVDKLRTALEGQEEANVELKQLFESAVAKLNDGGKITGDSLDSLLDAEVSGRLPGLERGDREGYEGVLEGWHQEHMEALETQRLALLDAEREEKEQRLDRLLRETQGIKYWAKEIQEARRRREEAEVSSQHVEHR